ncbi:MAG TPA: alpha/beta hydrolase domain-containing protein, partial [Acidimicrobiales bacterium]
MAPLSGGNGVFLAEPINVNLKRFGYVQHEYVASGSAASYRPNNALSFSGRWSFLPDGHATYRTRVLVRYPANRARFSGTVIVEWLNVSGGVDADPEWASLYQEILRRGDAWVGVSAQQIGVMGGPVLVTVPGPGANVVGKGLRRIDPTRYGSLHLPGDGFSYDIFTQVARAVRAGA